MKCMVINGKQIFYGKHTVVYAYTQRQKCSVMHMKYVVL